MKSKVIVEVNKIRFIILAFLLLIFLFFPLGPSNSKLLISWPLNSSIDFILITTLIIAFNYLFFSELQIKRIHFYIFFVLTFIMILLKILFLNSNLEFRGCYKIISPINLEYASTYDCERSWENLFTDNFTRNDSNITFGFNQESKKVNKHINDGNWNLSALNSGVYAYYQDDQPNPYKLNLEISWIATLLNKQSIQVGYLGEGKIKVNNEVVDLPESYSKLTFKTIELNNEVNNIQLIFKWDKSRAKENYAAVSLTNLNGELIQNYNPLAHVVLEVVINIFSIGGIIFLLIIVTTHFIRRLSKPNIRINIPNLFLLTLASGTNLVYYNLESNFIWLSVYLVFVFLLLFSVSKFYKNRLFFGLTNLYLLWVTLILNSKFGHENFTKVIYRSRSDDFLTYESFARNILTSGSLQGGEDVFVYSPLIRYLLLVVHFFIGDADNLIFVIYLFFLFFAVNLLFKNLNLRLSSITTQDFILILTLLFFVIFLSSSPIFFGGFTLLSESPTWIILIFIFAILCKEKYSTINYIFIFFLSGILIMFRANQIVGVFIILILSLKLFLDLSPNLLRKQYLYKICFLLSPAFLSSFLITFFHNVYYGQRIQFLQTSLPLPVNFPLQVSDIFSIGSDPSIRNAFIEQAKGLLAFSPDLLTNDYFDIFIVSVRFAQVGFLLLCFYLLWNFSQNKLSFFIALCIPIGFLLPHLFIQIFVYHPRHIVIGYLSIYLILIYVLVNIIRTSKKQRIGNNKPLKSWIV